MNSIVTVFRLAVLALVIAVLVAIAVGPAGRTAASDQGVYDTSDLARVDYSGLPAPVAIAARDGARLAARVYDAPGNTVILAIHGSSGNGRYYYPMAQFLSGRGKATVYTLDLRGHGASDGRRGDVDYIGQLEDDVADVIAAIRARRPAARIVLLGHSAGGGLLVRYAGGGRGPAADGYVLLAPYLGPEAPTTKPDAGDGRARISRRSPRWWRGRRRATPRDRTRSSSASTSRHPPPRRARCSPTASGWSRRSRRALISAASCRRFGGHCSC
jgi:alpha-beta hydrolase superfamily lysophospholipase